MKNIHLKTTLSMDLALLLFLAEVRGILSLSSDKVEFFGREIIAFPIVHTIGNIGEDRTFTKKEERLFLVASKNTCLRRRQIDLSCTVSYLLKGEEEYRTTTARGSVKLFSLDSGAIWNPQFTKATIEMDKKEEEMTYLIPYEPGVINGEEVDVKLLQINPCADLFNAQPSPANRKHYNAVREAIGHNTEGASVALAEA